MQARRGSGSRAARPVGGLGPSRHWAAGGGSAGGPAGGTPEAAE
ncbi:hypothetical protein FB601_106305 [Burkholderia sp. SJZ091]|nr:hypothetical protein FB600_107305 [Burkholderia sp. SJZ089]TWD07012.1 hypothetical protein FB601_106305 [Burkholderia sp. SJZ091]